MKLFAQNRGSLLIHVIVFSAIAIFLLGGLVSWARLLIQSAHNETQKLQAFLIAESGTEYYRWHLAHAPEDFQDGTGSPGPYIHNFQDKDLNTIGQFSLAIAEPSVGSTIVVIQSTGSLSGVTNKDSTIETQLGVPSFSKYAVAANDKMRFGEGTEVFGHIHSNDGIRFDGLAHNIVSSSKEEYNDPDHSGNNEHGVHTHKEPVDPVPPENIPARPDVFEAGRATGVPAIDFDGLTSTLANLKTLAQNDGLYFAASAGVGYHMVLQTNDTFDLYQVDKLMSPPTNKCNNAGQQNWGTWSIAPGGETFLGTHPFPSNNLLFAEDHVWVDGQISNARITIAAGRFPEAPGQHKDIIINKDLLYTTYDGQDSIALISQGSISTGMNSEDDLRIDAALIAQNERVGRYYYRPPYWHNNSYREACDPYHTRSTITLYGMLATNDRYGFAYSDGSGYQTRNIIYDANLLYSPPPHFPLTSDHYEIISWKETN